MTGAWETVIGLEVHAQLLTRSKMFCGCATAFGAPPNHQTCPVCQGMPGVLPVINRRAIEFGIRTALALRCRINAECRFARKHYFYPDMPKNYQISQYEAPLAEDGWLEVETDGVARRIGIERLHLEEDVGKLTHEGQCSRRRAPARSTSTAPGCRSWRSCPGRISGPRPRPPNTCGAFGRSSGTSASAMGTWRRARFAATPTSRSGAPVRPSVGTKVEIKNMNSFRHVRDALEHEAARQARALDRGERIVQETRLWNPDRAVTVSMRSKEYAHDYRYFPDPDLVPVEPDPAWVAAIERELPELPRLRRQRFAEEYGLPPHDADLLTGDRALADYFEEAVRIHPNPKALANWIGSELLRELKGDPMAVAVTPIRPAALARLVALVDEGTISGKMAKELFERMARTGEEPSAIVRREGLHQVADETAIGRVIDEVVAAHPRVVEDYRRGKKQAAGFLVGQVMKATQGKANPQVANRLLAERLGGS